jgi:hypothetical protein
MRHPSIRTPLKKPFVRELPEVYLFDNPMDLFEALGLVNRGVPKPLQAAGFVVLDPAMRQALPGYEWAPMVGPEIARRGWWGP